MCARAADDLLADRRRFIWSTLAGALLGGAVFVAVLWNFGFEPLRTALPTRLMSAFYDTQARALLDGRLDVPPHSLGIEAFVVNGRHYMYFPPFPAVLRMPVLLLTDRLDGRLTAPSMLIAWVVTSVLTAMLLWRVRTILRPQAPLGRLEAGAYGAFVLTVSGGSILVFIASLPWVYHEAYSWGIAGCLGAMFCLLGLIERPGWRGAVATAVWVLIAITSRTTAGWACAGAVVVTAAWFAWGGRGADVRRRWWLVLSAGLVPLIIGASINWAKFRHPWMFPLDKQVWTQLSEHRRRALRENGGSLTGLHFLPTGLINYFRPDGIRFVSIFPYITLPAKPARGYFGAFVDEMYRTGSVPAFQPALFASSVVGAVRLLTNRARERVRWLVTPAMGAAAVPGGVLCYGYLAHRYTAEFLPGLVVLGAIGVVLLGERFSRWRPLWRRAALGVAAALVVFSVLANGATALHSARLHAGGSSLREYLLVRERLSRLTGQPLDAYVRQGTSLPERAPADELHIAGSCDLLALATGENLVPWVVVEAAEVVLELSFRADNQQRDLGTPRGSLELFRLVGHTDLVFSLERMGYRRYRLVANDSKLRVVGPWFPADPGMTFVVAVRSDILRQEYQIVGPEFWWMTVPMGELDKNWRVQPRQLLVARPSPAVLASEGLDWREVDVPRPALCERLARRAGTPSASGA